MAISFNQIPADRKVPFVYIEFDNKRAITGPGVQPYRALLIGQKTSYGSQAAEVPVSLSTPDQARGYFGEGSMLHKMSQYFFQNNSTTETWAVALDDSGAAASGSFVFSGPATDSGTVYAYIGGEQIQVSVANGDTASTISAALAAAINADDQLEVIATDSSGTVNIIAKNAGAKGNEIDIRVNYNDGEELPAGVGVTVNALSSGSGEPSIQDAIDAIGSEQYNVIIHPYTDSTNLGDLEDELDSRWGPLVQNDGVAITSKRDSYANLVTLGDARNSPHSSILAGTGIPQSPWNLAAAAGARVSASAQIDPARPFQTLQLTGLNVPSILDRLLDSQRDQLLKHGIATVVPSPGGILRIERMRMTYKENEVGAPDESYADMNTVLTLSYLRYSLRTRIQLRYPRHKLADDGTRYAAGQAVVTPKVLRSEIILLFKEWEELALVEGISQFKADLIVERNANDKSRIDVLMPPDLVNQLRVVGAQIQFLL